jgi:microcystin-dependent protein
MSEPFLAEIRMVGFNFAPRGWAFCDGQLLPISQNQSLYSLLGTMYGGDGRTTFALPDLRGRVPIHVGSSNGHFHQQGERSGEETHTLSVQEMPRHAHLQGSGDRATEADPTDRVLASRPRRGLRIYSGSSADVGSGASSTGGGQAHTNMQPYLAVNFCIALQGLFPSHG